MKGKLLIATPTHDRRVTSLTYASVMNLDRCGLDVKCIRADGFDVALNRNRIASYALGNGFDWVLFVDSDVGPYPDALANLLSHNLDVCFGFYVSSTRRGDSTCLVEAGQSGYGSLMTGAQLRALADGGINLVDVKAAGLGFALVNTSVFIRLAKPWFQYLSFPDGNALSEDYYFCKKCHGVGIRLAADTRVVCRHYTLLFQRDHFCFRGNMHARA